MANIDTVKAIFTNIEAILAGVTVGYEVEDLSVNPPMTTTPVCQLVYKGETFEESFGEHPLYNIIYFKIVSQFRCKTQNEARDKQAEMIHKYRAALTIATLNVGSLVTSKLVSWVDHDEAENEYENMLAKVTYNFTVRYRET